MPVDAEKTLAFLESRIRAGLKVESYASLAKVIETAKETGMEPAEIRVLVRKVARIEVDRMLMELFPKKKPSQKRPQ